MTCAAKLIYNENAAVEKTGVIDLKITEKYKYNSENKDGDICLHDCRATEIFSEGKMLSFFFKDGFYVGNKYSDRSELRFELEDNAEYDVWVYVFDKTDGRTVREEISVNKLMDMVNSGMELEFISEYQGYNTKLYECWLWFDKEPYHKECVLKIYGNAVSYHWNELFAEEI